MANTFFNISGYFEKNRKTFWVSLIVLCALAFYFSDHLHLDKNVSRSLQTTYLFISLLLLLVYGRIELLLISILSLFVSFAWTLGLIGIFSIQVTSINSLTFVMMMLPAICYNVFFTLILVQEYKTGKKKNISYTTAVFFLAIAGGSCYGIFKLDGLKELKLITLLFIVTIIFSFITTQVLTPFLFNTLIYNRAKRKRFPWTFFGMLKSAFAFTYFVVASLILTMLGLIFVKLYPFRKEKGKLIYHSCVSKFCWSLMYIMGNVKKKIINPHKEDFSKPAVIICNHQSFLDILSMVMLTPKLILFTNHWVWNSPVFGFVVRMADYYPVMQGADGSIDLVADRVRKGYSVVVFPEGTRSVDGNMKRFHKGAFYLAEKTNLDILPVLIHGSGYTMSKGDFLLKDGTITLQILPRIKPSDPSFGRSYAEKTKSIGRYFRTSFTQLRTELEKPVYFKEQLTSNYIFKGPVLEWYMRIKLRFENYYILFNDLLPKQGRFLDAGCGYGFMSYMLHFVSDEREITGIDYDATKIDTANHCFSKNEKINFICSDVLQFNYEKYDGIILADVLHYLRPSEQKQAIEKCLQNLNENGILIIRDGNKDLAERHRGTRITEFFSTTFSGFNKTTENGLSYISGSMIREIANEQQMESTEIDPSKYTSNMIFVIKKTPVTIHAAV